MNILKTVDLQKIYGQGETEVKALDGVNLEVEKGEFVAIVGTSGSGKSTMLHIIGGLDNPTSGQVIVDGQNLSHMTDEELTIFRRRNIGFVFQQYKKEEIPKIFGRFYRSLSVADQPGVGIGLFLAREIIQAQKGYIKVTSERGKGSIFSVFLPISKKE